MKRGDYNEMNHVSNPELRIHDSVSFGWAGLRNSLRGGVTTLLFIPGSGTVVSGFGCVIKPGARGPRDGIVRELGVMKIAHAFNPRRGSDFGSTLMGLTWHMREALRRGREYAERRRGKAADDLDGKELAMENIRAVVEREIPALVHTQYFQVTQGSVRVCNDEAGIDAFIGHGTFDAFLNAPYVKRLGVPVTNGPRQAFLDPKTGRIHGCAAEWHARGIEQLSINTDAPVVPQEELPFQAAMACWLGLPTEVALCGLTRVPAEFLGIDDRVGTLEVGKDADFVLWTGNPIDPRSTPREVYTNGRLVYQEGRGPSQE
jgi:imidazolonepropionase-like amidohydrolase